MTPAMLTNVLINLAIFVVIFLGSLYFIYKIKLEHKGYKYLFVTYTFFWIAPMLLRPYAGTIQNAIDIDYTWLALAVYGVVGIFIRTFADAINFAFKTRKAFLYFAIISQIAFYIPLIISPSTTTSILQSIGVGIGASCIGSFQLLFKEQYSKSKTYLTVSILSIPPLLANFLTSPIQSILMSISKTQNLVNLDVLKYMWLIGLIFVVVAFILIFFIKERRSLFDSITNNQIFKIKSDGSQFLIICLIGLLVSFIKFSNSGAVGTLHLQTLANLMHTNSAAYEGYLSMIFSIFQLMGGVLVGTILIKKFKTIYIFMGGCIVWLIYTTSVIFVNDPIAYFSIHALNGFAYGLLYNLILGKVLSSNFNGGYITPMGIYQSTLAIGIASSSAFTQIIKNNLKNNYFYANRIVNVCLIASIILLMMLYLINHFLVNKRLKIQRFNI